MKEEYFKLMIEQIQKANEIEILITDIQMKLDNEFGDIESDLKYVLELVKNIQNEERNIYYEYYKED